MRAGNARAAPDGALDGPGLAVTRLVLTDFRNYAALRFEVPPESVVLTGPNGAGKTNVLEALSLLAPGRGLRRARLSDLARRDASGAPCPGRGWAVAAHLALPAGGVAVGTGIEGGAEAGDADDERPERRTVRIDGRTARGPAVLTEVAAVRWLTPAMDRLWMDGAAGRRRFLDHLAAGLDASHAGRVSAYERALRERARLLRETGWNPAWVAALEETMAEFGTAIAATRRDYAARLAAVVPAAGPLAAAEVRGDLEDWLAGGPALEAETRFREALAASRDRDGAAGGAALGPHRSDLAVTHASGLPADQCSTGEQKALLLVLIEADVRLVTAATGRAPLVLLDEVAAHLDAERRTALLDVVLALGTQVWATGTDRAAFCDLDGRAGFYSVAAGRVVSS